MNPWLRVLLRLVFPVVCPHCKIDHSSDLAGPLCDLCRKNWIFRPHVRRGGGQSLSLVLSADEFDGPMRALIHGLKYRGRAAWVDRLVRRAWEVSEGGRLRFDCIVPVPMSYFREIRRGYNQAFLIAEALSSLTGKPVVSGMLKSSLWGASQTRFGKVGRRKNAGRRFQLKIREPFPYRRVLLVDDVTTTGATLERCAHLLKQVGVQRVAAFVLARDL